MSLQAHAESVSVDQATQSNKADQVSIVCQCTHLISKAYNWPGPNVIKFVHAQLKLSMKFILLITGVGILTFISRINITSGSFKARQILIIQHFSFYEQLQFHA